MGGDFTIDTDVARCLLVVRMSGFFTPEDVTRYHAAIGRASKSLPCPAADQVMTNDISEMKIQSQEIVAAFQRVMSDARFAGRRVGFIATSSLARAQLSRVIGSRTARIFASVAEAEAWLFAPEADRTADRVARG